MLNMDFHSVFDCSTDLIRSWSTATSCAVSRASCSFRLACILATFSVGSIATSASFFCSAAAFKALRSFSNCVSCSSICLFVVTPRLCCN